MNSPMKTLVHQILLHADDFEWSLQGMGMLRLHMPDNTRLHIWDSRYRVPDVSMIHDHLQWGLTSTIIAGRVDNYRYTVDPSGCGMPYMFAVLKPGVGCHFKTEPQEVSLRSAGIDVYTAGESYSHEPADIHQTAALDGTVTLMKKLPTGDESARVFWPAGKEWVSAEPRRARVDEVRDIVDLALSRWFK